MEKGDEELCSELCRGDEERLHLAAMSILAARGAYAMASAARFVIMIPTIVSLLPYTLRRECRKVKV